MKIESLCFFVFFLERITVFVFLKQWEEDSRCSVLNFEHVVLLPYCCVPGVILLLSTIMGSFCKCMSFSPLTSARVRFDCTDDAFVWGFCS